MTANKVMDMIEKSKIQQILSEYKKPAITTICSHSSLQIFHGAKQQGFKTIGICLKGKEKLYSAFPFAKPDEFIFVNSYAELPVSELVAREAILIPHGSFVEYVGEKLDNLPVPVFGNRASMVWERSREKLFDWIYKAGLKTPKVFLDARTIDRPVIVKFAGAKGGKGYIVINSYEEYRQKVGEKKAMVQEFLTGVRIYPHYFFSPLSAKAYSASKGSIELLGIDRRIESNADEIGRAIFAGAHTKMSFTVVANEAIVLRESLLHEYLEIGKKVVESADKLFGGFPGPFCIETIITPELEIYVFEISARIVAGTNVSPSPYSIFLNGKPVSMGERIAMEIKQAIKMKKLNEIVY